VGNFPKGCHRTPKLKEPEIYTKWSYSDKKNHKKRKHDSFPCANAKFFFLLDSFYFVSVLKTVRFHPSMGARGQNSNLFVMLLFVIVCYLLCLLLLFVMLFVRQLQFQTLCKRVPHDMVMKMRGSVIFALITIVHNSVTTRCLPLHIPSEMFKLCISTTTV